MMELVYLWVEEYKNIHKQGFNFSPKFNCNYDPDTNVLTIDENDDYIENFFGENINVTAIVGKNGSGKSSIFEVLKSLIIDNSDINHNFSIFIHKNKFYYYNQRNELHIFFREFNVEKIDICALPNIITHSANSLDNYLFMNSLNSMYEFDNDLSYQTYKDSIPSDDWHWGVFKFDIMKYRAYAQNLILNYILKKKNTFFNPDKFTLHPNNTFFIWKLSSIVSYYSSDKFTTIENKLKKIIVSYSNESKTALYVFLKKINDNSTREKTTKLIATYYEKNTIPEKEIIFNYLSKNEKDLVQRIDGDLNIGKQHNLNDNKTKQLLLGILNNPNIKSIFTDLYQIVLFESRFKRAFKDLSKGEKDLLLLLSLLENQIHNQEKTLILLDEIESFFHPSWSKNIIKLLLEGLVQSKIHLIFTTHSPFLLSDIPKQNIIFLDTYEDGKCKVLKHDEVMSKKQTFGANIHTLLSDSFFMEDGLMGEFAKSKIDEVIKLLNKEHLEPSEIKYCEQIISIIGEPIVKNQLQKMLDSKRLKKIDRIDEIEKSIQALQEELEKLNNEKS